MHLLHFVPYLDTKISIIPRDFHRVDHSHTNVKVESGNLV